MDTNPPSSRPEDGCLLPEREELILDYLHKNLTEEQEIAFEAHYFDCRACLRDLRIAREIAAVLAESSSLSKSTGSGTRDQGVPGPSARQRLPDSRRLMWPAIAMAILLLSSTWFYFFRQSSGTDEAALRAERMVPSAHYEQLIGNAWRSTGLEVLVPINGASYRDTVRFEWRYAGSGALQLTLLSNSEEELFSTEAPDGFVAINSARINLAPGLYYWTLQDGGNLLYAGKFFLERSDH